jgi:hypothetical protein
MSSMYTRLQKGTCLRCLDRPPAASHLPNLSRMLGDAYGWIPSLTFRNCMNMRKAGNHLFWRESDFRIIYQCFCNSRSAFLAPPLHQFWGFLILKLINGFREPEIDLSFSTDAVGCWIFAREIQCACVSSTDYRMWQLLWPDVMSMVAPRGDAMVVESPATEFFVPWPGFLLHALEQLWIIMMSSRTVLGRSLIMHSCCHIMLV